MLQTVLRQYPIDFRSVDDRGNAGGFSGANLWRIETAHGDSMCLRRWPAEQSSDRLDWIHLVLRRAAAEGLPVAVPVETTAGPTWLSHQSRLYELSRWMPGKADFNADPSEGRLLSAATTLAKFHQAAAQVNLDFGRSLGLEQRTVLLSQYQSTLASVRKHFARHPSPPIDVRHLLESTAAVPTSVVNRTLAALQTLSANVFPLQPVIRDVWHDHLLFTDDEVTGLVDFGAMRMDIASLDLSRMLGSLVGDDVGRQRFAVAAYDSVRKLSDSERDAIAPLIDAQTILSAANWLNWLVVERRTFADPGAVEKRVADISKRVARIQ